MFPFWPVRQCTHFVTLRVQCVGGRRTKEINDAKNEIAAVFGTGCTKQTVPFYHSASSAAPSTSRIEASAVSEPQALSVGDGGRTVPDSPPTAESSRVSSPASSKQLHGQCDARHAPRLHDSGESCLGNLSVLDKSLSVCGLSPVRVHHWPAIPPSSARKLQAASCKPVRICHSLLSGTMACHPATVTAIN